MLRIHITIKISSLYEYSDSYKYELNTFYCNKQPLTTPTTSLLHHTPSPALTLPEPDSYYTHLHCFHILTFYGILQCQKSYLRVREMILPLKNLNTPNGFIINAFVSVLKCSPSKQAYRHHHIIPPTTISHHCLISLLLVIYFLPAS